MDPEVLINEVYARPPLWDRSSPAHSNRDVVAGLWKEVAEACGVSSDVAKAKWKHLRDHFRCELKRCLRSRAGKAGRYRSSWVWFWPLVFLKEQMLKQRYRDGGDESGVEDETGAVSGGDDALTVAGDGVPPATIKTEPNTVPRAPCKRRRIPEPTDRDFLDLDRRMLLAEDPSPPAAAVPPYDDTEHFLLSLAPALRTLPLARQMLVRLKVQELVSNEVIASQEACPPPPDADTMAGHNVVETALEIPEIDQSWAPEAGVPGVAGVAGVTAEEQAAAWEAAGK